MGWDGILVIALTLGSLVLLVLEKASIDAIGLGLVVALVGTGILDIGEALKGFSNYAVVTIAALYIVGEGLTRTGAVEFLAHWVLTKSGGVPWRLILLMGLIAAGVSAFINNTAVVVVFIPVLVGMSRSTGIAASKLLIPLSFASILGGMCTLVGTSTNLFVSGVAEQMQAAAIRADDPFGAAIPAGIGMFEMSAIGVPLTLAGIVFMAFFAQRLLPTRQSLTTSMAETTAREYVTEVVIGAQSKLRGLKYAETFTSRASLLCFIRGDEMNWPPYFNEEIEIGDVVILRGGVDEMADLQESLGLKLVGDLSFDPRTMSFFELSVSPRSAAVGHPIGELRLFRDYGVMPVAVLRAGHHVRDRLSNLNLRAGDVLLVCGEDKSQVRLSNSPDFYLMTGAQKSVVLRSYARRALWIAGLVVVLFASNSIPGFKLMPVPTAAMIGALCMVASGCVTARRAYRAIDWPILMFVAGTLGLGVAMEKTGAAAFFAKGITEVLADFGPAVVTSGLVLLCIIFNALISHSAVAVLLTPIAIAAAANMVESEGLDPGEPRAMSITRAFILAIAFGGSICFATPIGHQTNLMVYGPGGYRYSDYVKLGIPISLIAWIIVSLGIPWITGI